MTVQIDEGELGPHMKALLPKQRAFVYALVETGGNNTQAAMAAGYGEDSPSEAQRLNACKVRGYQLAHDKRILKAIKEEAEKRLHGGALLAASRLMEIVDNPMHKSQLKAIEMVLDRAGMIVSKELNVNVNHNIRSNDEQVAHIMETAQKLGIDGRLLLGNVGHVIDAEFHDITPTTEGLEDLL